MGTDEVRATVPLTNLDQPLFEDAGVTKRQLVDYLDGVRDRLLPALARRPLSVLRVLRGQAAFMQKNVPRYAPDWLATVSTWAESSHREVRYALCDDRRSLLWFANQRAVEYHPALFRVEDPDRPTHLVLDVDPPGADDFPAAVQAALLAREALAAAGLDGAVKTSGAKGLHVFVPVREASAEDVAAATRALAVRAERLDPALVTTAFVRAERAGKVFLDATRAGAATVAAVYSPRIRPGTPVSWPLGWGELEGARPGEFTVRSVPGLLGGRDPWAEAMPAPQPLDPELVAEGHTIPVARVQAMHAGLRRARERRAADPGT